MKKTTIVISYSFMSEYPIIIAYGFEYECRIWDVNYRPYDAIFCMTIDNYLPFYASSYRVVGETAISNISEQIMEIESNYVHALREIDRMARLYLEKPSWRMVYYNHDGSYKEMNAGYASEGDEYGNSR